MAEKTVDCLLVVRDVNTVINYSDINGFRQGMGAIFNVKPSGNWFHFLVPTPVVVSDKQVKVLRVLLLWDILDVVGLPPRTIAVNLGPSRVHVWDGGLNRILARDLPLPIKNGPGYAQRLNGSAGFFPGLNSFDIPGTPTVSFGLCISLFVNGDGGRIQFIGAGADFESIG